MSVSLYCLWKLCVWELDSTRGFSKYKFQRVSATHSMLPDVYSPCILLAALPRSLAYFDLNVLYSPVMERGGVRDARDQRGHTVGGGHVWPENVNGCSDDECDYTISSIVVSVGFVILWEWFCVSRVSFFLKCSNQLCCKMSTCMTTGEWWAMMINVIIQHLLLFCLVLLFYESNFR